MLIQSLWVETGTVCRGRILVITSISQFVTGPRVFLSYSRSDLDFARSLRDKLNAEGLSVWHDIKNIGSGQWWSQIEDALVGSEAVEHVLLVVSPKSLASKIVEREWRLARLAGKTVSAVIASDFHEPVNFGSLPAWMQAQHFYNLGIPEQYEKLLHVLKGPGQQARRPMMAPTLPSNFVQRTREFEALKLALLTGKGDAIAITATLRGAGGFGKTMLAAALAHDEDIREAFYDGILWVTLDENPNLVQIIAELIYTLTNKREGYTEIGPIANRLKEVLEHKHCLLVVDDVWAEGHLRPFLDGAEHVTRLITTRRNDILREVAVRICVDAMTVPEAVSLLSRGLPEPGSIEKAELLMLARDRLGEWPLLLSQVNGFLRQRILGGESLNDALSHVVARLDRRGLAAFDPALEPDRAAAVDKTVGVGLEMLAEFDKKGRSAGFHSNRLSELAVFPKDVDVPIATIARVWNQIAHLEDDDSEELLERLFDLALIQRLDLKRRTVRLHDVMLQYLADRAGQAAVVGFHRAIVAAYKSMSASQIETEQERRYFYKQFPMHLHEAGDRKTLEALLVDPGWMQEKLAILGDALPLVHDYEKLGTGEAAGLIGRALRISSSIITRDPRQLFMQLLGRLSPHTPGLNEFLRACREHLRVPALLPAIQTLSAPGAELLRLEAMESVHSICGMIGGTVASGGYSGIQIWNATTTDEVSHLPCVARVLGQFDNGDLVCAGFHGDVHCFDVTTGTEIASFTDPSDVESLCILPHRQIACGSWGARSIRIWDATSGLHIASLVGHKEGVATLCLLEGGLLASGSFDQTVRIWRLADRSEVACLKGHRHSVLALCVLPNNRLASGAIDRSIRIWDLVTTREIACLQGHHERVSALCALPEGRLASASEGATIGYADGVIRIWDLANAKQCGQLAGHQGWVTGLAALPDGRLVSGSTDRTVRVWNPAVAVQAATSGEGHTAEITGTCLLADGRLASASRDGTIRIWDTSTYAQVACFGGDVGEILALCLSAEGCLATGSRDNAIHLWDLRSGTISGTMRQPQNAWHIGISALRFLDNEHLVSASWDKSIRIWDVKRQRELRPLSINLSEEDDVVDLCPLPRGRLALGILDNSGSDGVIIWDIVSDTKLSHLYPGGAKGFYQLDDGRLMSGKGDGTIYVWNLDQGNETIRFQGHRGAVNVTCQISAVHVASGSDDNTVRVWNLHTGNQICSLELDAGITCLVPLSDRTLVAGDAIGRIHWLELIID